MHVRRLLVTYFERKAAVRLKNSGVAGGHILKGGCMGGGLLVGKVHKKKKSREEK